MFRHINIWLVTGCVLLTILLGQNRIFADNIKANDDKNQKVSYDQLPSVVIAYGVIVSNYSQFSCIFRNNNILKRLSEELDKLPGGISTKLSLMDTTFILQNTTGQFAGYKQDDSQSRHNGKIPYKRFLFITNPIESFGNRVVAIISSVSPEQTTVISIDNSLKTDLLYDSFYKNDIRNIAAIRGSRVLGSIYSVKVTKPGVFELRERLEPGARGFAAPEAHRTFYIDISKGKFELSASEK